MYLFVHDQIKYIEDVSSFDELTMDTCMQDHTPYVYVYMDQGKLVNLQLAAVGRERKKRRPTRPALCMYGRGAS